jgi:excisionase family DNA binding protein
MPKQSPKRAKALNALPSNLEPLLTTPQIAAYLNVCPRTVENWTAISYIPCVRIGTSPARQTVRFDRNEVMEWRRKLSTPGRKTRMPAQEVSL